MTEGALRLPWVPCEVDQPDDGCDENSDGSTDQYPLHRISEGQSQGKTGENADTEEAAAGA